MTNILEVSDPWLVDVRSIEPATILPGIKIGNGAMICGAAITKDVPPNALVFGESCTIKGYISDDKEKLKLDQPLKSTQSNLVDLGISGSKLYTFNKFTDSWKLVLQNLARTSLWT